MEGERVERIVLALRRAAEHERLLSYQRFHAMFGAGDPLTARYDALERAIASLGEVSDIDYGVLLALSNGFSAQTVARVTVVELHDAAPAK